MRARVRATTVASASFVALLFHTPFLRAALSGPPTGPNEERSSSRLVPPKLEIDATADYPTPLRGSGRQAVVELQLHVDQNGLVKKSQVVTSAGPEFDEAALEAAKSLRFLPATRDGVPIAARIPFRFSFADPGSGVAQAPAPAATASPAGVVSTVPGDAVAGLTAASPLPGDAGAGGVAPSGSAVVPAAPLPGDGASAPTESAPNPADEVQEIRVVGQRPAREPTRRVLEAREFRRVPGANGDPLRVIESLPGVARPPGLSGMLIVRGSGPTDTNVFVDGTWVPMAYHFGGLTSVVPADVLSRIEFVPGNYGPEYGRGTGGIVELGLRSPRSDRLGGLVQFDVLDGRFLVESPLGKRARFLIAGRRSWFDTWFGPLMKEADINIPAAPVYYDGQAILEYDISENTRARIAAFGSDDRFAMINSAPSSSDPGAGGDFGIGTSFTRIQARLDSQISERTKLSQMFSYGTNFSRFSMASLRTEENIQIAEARTDIRHKLARGLTMFGGIDFQYGSYNIGLMVPSGHDEREEGGDGVGSPLYGTTLRKLEGKGTMIRPAAFVGVDYRPAPGLQIIPSVRLDYADDTRRTTVDPRLSLRWDIVRGGVVDDGPPRLRTTLKAGAGIYRRPPNPSESLPPWGQSGLNVPRSFHGSLGIEQELAPGIDVSVEGFAKWMDLLVVTEDAHSSSANGVHYSNSGQGRILGGELLFRVRPKGRFFGWVAYTLSRSERRGDDSARWEGFQYDQTHILTALAGYDLGGGWEIGARYRLVSGELYTPYVGSTLDLDAGVYSPVGAERPFSARMDPFHRLDVRVDKTFKFNHWKLVAYLDVQNAYSYRSPETIQYNYRYTQSSPLGGIPIVPVLGLRGEL